MRHSVPAALTRPAQIPLADRAAWSVSDAALALGVSQRLLTRLIAEGKLPASRLGRRVLLDPVAVRHSVFGPEQSGG